MFLGLVCLACHADPVTVPAARPNILLIVADDVGLADIGAWGSEVATPNLDALARRGVLLNDFHSAPTCSPTRSMLMSGADNHVAGLGNMHEAMAPNQRGLPGYEGHLNFRVAALPEVLQDAGYFTAMAGKWHLGLDEATSPAARGFHRSYALLHGGGGHFSDLGLFLETPKALYREDGKYVELPVDFHSSRDFADRLMAYLSERPADGRPFLAYLAFTAAHWPLQALAADRARYAGRYDAGYDVLQAQRLRNMQARGLAPASAVAAGRLPGEPAWDALTPERQRREARLMEIYAAMVTDMDRQVGRVVDFLRHRGELDRTFIFFMSDNSTEGEHLENGFPTLNRHIANCCNNDDDNMGEADSYLWYGPNWARAGATPYRGYKGFTYEGGIRVPAIAVLPGGAGGRVSAAFSTVKDVMPTILDLAGIPHPAPSFRGRDVVSPTGETMLPMLRGEAGAVHRDDYVMGWELFGFRAIRQGDWKLAWNGPPVGPGRWELFDLAADVSEQHDLSRRYPGRLRELLDLWDEYMERNGVILPVYPPR